MALNGGLGKVTDRDIVFSTDTLIPAQINAVRHGNGRDWWLLAPYYLGNRFYRFLLDPTGLHRVGKQDIPTTDLGLGHTCFSPNGQWYARFNWPGVVPDSSFSVIELYRFDRCSGLLSERVSKTYDLSGLNGKPGGVAFSPSSRFLYVTRWDSVFQYDLHATDIIASEKTVAVYDGFLGDLGLPTRFFYPLLAPDNKIYICVSNYNSPYLHVIENPDAPGLACNVQQHNVRLPVFNNFLLPNMPYYRLWDWKDAPCDTLGSVGVKGPLGEMKGFSVYPNPVDDLVNIVFEQDVEANCLIELLSMTGQVLQNQEVGAGNSSLVLPVQQLPNGCYLIRVSSAGQPATFRKISIVH
ncbi:MAG: T9SS type A sorting domain-containing protein [Bacteroidota bacterium]